MRFPQGATPVFRSPAWARRPRQRARTFASACEAEWIRGIVHESTTRPDKKRSRWTPGTDSDTSQCSASWDRRWALRPGNTGSQEQYSSARATCRWMWSRTERDRRRATPPAPGSRRTPHGSSKRSADERIPAWNWESAARVLPLRKDSESFRSFRRSSRS